MALVRARSACALLLLCALLMPAAFAATRITNIAYEGEGLVKVGAQYFIVADTPVSGTLRFTVDEDTSLVVVDVAGLDQRIVGSLANTITTDRCTDFVCELPVEFYLAKGSTKRLTWNWSEPAGRPNVITTPIGLDTVAPVYRSLSVGSCVTGCSIKSGTSEVLVSFTEAGVGIDASTVKVKYGAQLLSATACAGANCTVSVSVPSGTRSPISLQLQPGVKDLAGNTMAGTPAAVSLAIDDAAPVITAVTFTQGVNAVPIITGSFLLTVKVTDTSAIKATVDVSALDPALTNAVAMTCASGSCTLRISPEITAGQRTASITIVVSDAAGNTVTDTRSLQVAVTERINGTFWRTSSAQMTPRSFDPQSASLFSTRAFMKVNLEPVAEADIAYVRAKKCSFTKDNRPISLTLVDSVPGVLGAGSATPTVSVTVRPTGSVLDSVTGIIVVSCDLEVYSYVDGVMSSTPQAVVAKANWALESSPLLPEQYKSILNEQKEKQARIDKAYRSVQSVYSIVSGTCAVIGTSRTAEGVGRGLHAVLGSIPITKGIAQPIMSATNTLETGNNKLEKATAPLCKMMTCDYVDKLPWGGAYNSATQWMSGEKLGDEVLGPGGTDALARTISGGGADAQSLLSPYNSYLIAGATLCVPAMMHHLENYRSIECSYTKCLEVDVAAGVPLSACQEEHARSQCRFIYGGVLSATPLAIYEQVRSSAIRYITRPTAIIGYFASKNGCAVIPDAGAHGWCRLPTTINVAADAAQVVNRLKQLKAGFSKPATSCEASGVYNDPFYNLPGSATCTGAGLCMSGKFALGQDGKYCAIQESSKGQKGGCTFVDASDVPRENREAITAAQQYYKVGSDAIDGDGQVDANDARARIIRNDAALNRVSATRVGTQASDIRAISLTPAPVASTTTPSSAASGKAFITGYATAQPPAKSAQQSKTSTELVLTCAGGQESCTDRFGNLISKVQNDGCSKVGMARRVNACGFTPDTYVRTESDTNIFSANSYTVTGTVGSNAQVKTYTREMFSTQYTLTSTFNSGQPTNPNFLNSVSGTTATPAIGPENPKANTLGQQSPFGSTTRTPAGGATPGTTPATGTTVPSPAAGARAATPAAGATTNTPAAPGTSDDPIETQCADNSCSPTVSIPSLVAAAKSQYVAIDNAVNGVAVTGREIGMEASPMMDRTAFNGMIDSIAADPKLTPAEKAAKITAFFELQRSSAAGIAETIQEELIRKADEGDITANKILYENRRAHMTPRQRTDEDIGAGLRLSTSVDVLSYYVRLPQFLTGNSRFIQNVEDNVPSAIGMISDAFCGSDVRDREQSNVQAINPSGTPGIAIIAVREPSIIPQLLRDYQEQYTEDERLYGVAPLVQLPEQDMYNYIARGRMRIEVPIEDVVSEEDQSSPREYRVELRGVGTPAILTTGMIEPGVAVSWTKANQLKLQSAEEYDQLCVVFAEDLTRLFPRNDLSGTDVCVPLVIT